MSRPRLRVVVLEELEADTDGVMAKVLSFVGLPPADVKGGGAGHACVHGKAGIMDDHPDPRLKTANFGKADSSGLAVGECGSETHKKAGKAGTKVYPIDANTTAQLQAYFAPHNAMLYKLLGPHPRSRPSSSPCTKTAATSASAITTTSTSATPSDVGVKPPSSPCASSSRASPVSTAHVIPNAR